MIIPRSTAAAVTAATLLALAAGIVDSSAKPRSSETLAAGTTSLIRLFLPSRCPGSKGRAKLLSFDSPRRAEAVIDATISRHIPATVGGAEAESLKAKRAATQRAEICRYYF